MEQERTNLSEEQEKIDLTILLDDLWRGIKKFWWCYLILIVLWTGWSYVKAARSYSPVYQAYSTFVVSTKNAYGYSEDYYNISAAEQMSKTFPYILTSSALNQVVANDLGYASVPASITAEAMESSPLFTIRVTGSDPQLVYDVLQSVITNYPVVAEYIIGDTELTPMDESGVPDTPINSPNPMAGAKRGFFQAAVLCMVLLCFYALTRNTVRRESDLKARLSVPYLGSVPEIRGKSRSNRAKNRSALLLDGKNGNILGESVRVIRNRILQNAEKEGVRSILVTSTAAGEGKSTLAVNLAIALAKKKKRVILVDGDLRNPTVGEIMGLTAGEAGAAEVLDGGKIHSKYFQQYRNLNLLVLTGKKSDLAEKGGLQQDRIRQVVDYLKTQCDYVIIDTPPCGVMSDASQFARCVDGAVFVVRQDYMRVDRILLAMELLSETGVSLLGYLINGARNGIASRDYGYGYGYGYGSYGSGKYGYGYGEKSARDKRRTAFEEPADRNGE